MGNLMETINKLIDSAKNAIIEIAKYNFKDYHLKNSTVEGRSRVVDVKLIVDKSNLSNTKESCLELRNLKKAAAMMCLTHNISFFF